METWDETMKLHIITQYFFRMGTTDTYHLQSTDDNEK